MNPARSELGASDQFGIKEPPVLFCKLFPKEDVVTWRDYFMIGKLSVAMFCDELREPP
jgi:hypothetical protein